MLTPDLYIGTSSWKFDDWKGAFYPNAVSDDLAYYARHFDTVEIDNTWYRIPAPHVVESWARRVPDGFRFAAKAPRAITHDAALVDCADILQEFLSAMERLGDHLGPILFQFPPHWTAECAGALRTFLRQLPAGWRFAMEFRHHSWYHDRYAEWLRVADVAWALPHATEFPPVIYATAPFTYIRWLGNREEPMEPFNELKKDRDWEEDRWMKIIAELPVSEVWGYFNNHWGGFSPGSANAFKAKLGLPTVILEEKSEQGTLF